MARIGKGPPQVLSAARGIRSEVNRFRVLGLLGDGGFGKVYRVWDRKRGGEYALKVFEQPVENGVRDERVSLEAGFLEAARDRTTSVPRLVEVGRFEVDYDTYFDASPEIKEIPKLDGAPYILMEVVEGISARELVWELEQRGQCLTQDGMLAFLHSIIKQFSLLGSLLNTDIKLENIIFTRNGLIKIVDWGCAKDEYDVVLSLRDNIPKGNFLGTPGAMAPEGGANLGDRTGYQVKESEVYSAGLCAIQMRYLISLFKGYPSGWGQALAGWLRERADVTEDDLYNIGFSRDPQDRPILDLFLGIFRADPKERPSIRDENDFRQKELEAWAGKLSQRSASGDEYDMKISGVISQRLQKLEDPDLLEALEGPQFGKRVARGHGERRSLVEIILERKRARMEAEIQGKTLPDYDAPFPSELVDNIYDLLGVEEIGREDEDMVPTMVHWRADTAVHRQSGAMANPGEETGVHTQIRTQVHLGDRTLVNPLGYTGNHSRVATMVYDAITGQWSTLVDEEAHTSVHSIAPTDAPSQK